MHNDMLVVVIDNNARELLRLLDLIEEIFPFATVLPSREEPRTFGNWDEVLSYLQIVPSAALTVLCLDVALAEEDYSDAIRGLTQAGSIRTMKRDWIFVAYTRFGTRIASEANYIEFFDGMIEKANVDGKNRDQRLNYVKRNIDAAIRKKTNTQNLLPIGTSIVDSVGMRVFRAAFGDAAIAEIISNEGGDWKDVRLETLTTGHSGAFMLSISGRNESGRHSLVLKVARDERTIEQELRAQQIYLAQLGSLAGHLAVLGSDCIRLTMEAGVYYRQARIDGIALLDLLREGSENFDRQLTLRRVVDLCVNVCSDVRGGHGACLPGGEIFKLTPIDIGRIETSVNFLVKLGTAMTRHGLWTAGDYEVNDVGASVLALARGWSEWPGIDPELICVVQHGDLNPGNVIIGRDGSPVLIDLARLGHWPAGYDLARLSLMLRLRLIDWDGLEDWLHFGLGRWLSESTGSLEVRESECLCAEAAYCDRRFSEFLGELPRERQLILGYGYRLGTLWDLLKVMSYQDASHYKRMWAMIEAWRLKDRLEREIELLRVTGYT